MGNLQELHLSYEVSIRVLSWTIYPWSLDGLNQEHIDKMLMFMMTAYNAYIAGGQSLLQAYVLITQGFNGILQGWWAPR